MCIVPKSQKGMKANVEQSAELYEERRDLYQTTENGRGFLVLLAFSL